MSLTEISKYFLSATDSIRDIKNQSTKKKIENPLYYIYFVDDVVVGTQVKGVDFVISRIGNTIGVS